MSNGVYLWCKKQLQNEVVLTAAFFFSLIIASSNTIYLLLFLAYVGALYVANRNITKTLWIALISSFLFQRAKYFILPINLITANGAVSLFAQYYVSASDALLLILLFIHLRKTHIRAHLFQPSHIEVLFFPLLLIALASSWLSQFPFTAFFGTYQLLKYVLIFILSKKLLSNKEFLKPTLSIVFLFIVFNAVLIVLQKLHNGPLGIPLESFINYAQYGRFAFESEALFRPGGTVVDPNLSASILSMVLPVLIILGSTNNTFNKKLVWGACFLILLAIILTGSRAVWIILVITTPIIYLLARNKIPMHVPRKVAYIAIVLVIFSLPFIFLRIVTLRTALSASGTGTYRIRHVLLSVQYLLNHPLGIGLNTFQYAVVKDYPPEAYSYISAEPHNMLAQVGAELGVLGLLIYLFIIFLIIRSKLRSLAILNIRGIVLLCSVMVIVNYLFTTSVYPWFIYGPIGELFWLAGGLEYDKTV